MDAPGGKLADETKKISVDSCALAKHMLTGDLRDLVDLGRYEMGWLLKLLTGGLYADGGNIRPVGN